MGRGRKQGHIYEGKVAIADSHVAHLWSPKNTLDPKGVSVDHCATAIWLDPKCGHEWKLGIRYQALHSHCRICYPGKVIPGINDVETKRPDLVKDWHPDNEYSPGQLHEFSKQRVKWVCSTCGYEKVLSVGVRSRGKGCAACTGTAFHPGLNDFQTRCPESVHYWHPENSIKPSQIYYKSQKIVKWVCPRKHVWESAVHSRVFHGCPICSRENTTKVSKGEIELRNFIKDKGYQYLPNRRDIIGPYEIDITIESIKLAVEFNGDYWHSSKISTTMASGYRITEMPQVKSSMCEELGYKLIFVWEHDWLSHRHEVQDSLSKAIDFGVIDPILLKKESVLDKPCLMC
jgi:G:T-mismatch repair DNA endonuclease (very short patch repair protein)